MGFCLFVFVFVCVFLCVCVYVCARACVRACVSVFVRLQWDSKEFIRGGHEFGSRLSLRSFYVNYLEINEIRVSSLSHRV